MINPFGRTPRMLAPVARMYGRRLDQCGTTAQGVFWKDDAWHVRRFDRLVEIFTDEDATTGNVTINDFGCGYGAFFDHLSEMPIMQNSRYIGYDITQEMIAACRDRIDDPRAVFLRKMIATETADYSFACGTYNLNGRAHDTDWQPYVEDSLRQLWSKTRKALAFNMLRADETIKYDGLYYTDPRVIFDFCCRELSENTEMFDENPLPDVTYFVRRL